MYVLKSFQQGFSSPCAVHKFQGLTLSTTVVYLEVVKQRTFSPDQICVALSRSASLSKLNILSNFDPKIIRPNYFALYHYKYLRKKEFIYHKNLAKEIICCIVKCMWNFNKRFKSYG